VNTTETPTTAGELCTRHRTLLDRKDELNAELKQINELLADNEAAVRAMLEREGVDKISGNGITLFTKQKWRARYEPELWASLVEWASKSGRTDLIQRRLSDAKVMEYIDSGAEVPQGLSVEPYTSIEFRRS